MPHALQYGVPTTELDFSESEMATPKSASFTTPVFVVKMFAPCASNQTARFTSSETTRSVSFRRHSVTLMSLWITP